MDFKKCFQIIFENAVLLDSDRKSLREKRGFTDEQIDVLGLKSSGRYLLEKKEVQALPKEITKSLWFDNILIPYFDPNNFLFHLRPHRNGFEGASIRVYVPYKLFGEMDISRLVLAESEFKAAASCIMGVPAIGVPGISSFSKEHLPELIELIQSLGTKEVVVCFDNETKDHKPDFRKRYDTIVYEYCMAVLIAKTDGIRTRIARLNDEWRDQEEEDGKVKLKADIDSCLAKKIPPVDYQFCIDAAISPYKYRSQWSFPSKIHIAFVERKIERTLSESEIKEEFKSYWYKPSSGKHRRLTNFVIQIDYAVHTEKGMERFCRFDSNYGSSDSILISSEVMASKAAFQKLLYQLGDFEFYGRDEDLVRIWHHAFLHQDGRIVEGIKSFGFDEASGIWFFENGGYFNKKFCKADDDKIVWLEEQGFKLPSLDLRGDLAAPLLSQEPNEINLEIIWRKLSRLINEDYAKLILAWSLGVFFMPEILKEWKVYPFLFLYGKFGSGKSTLINFAFSFFGVQSAKGTSFKDNTIAGLRRISNLNSMIPLWLEEYRNDDPLQAKKNGYLRDVYDANITLQANKLGDGIKTYAPKLRFIISGEEPPRDAALFSRCITIPVYRDNNKTDEAFHWMQNNTHLFNSIGHQILLRKDELWAKIFSRGNEYLKAFNEGDMQANSRIRMHLSMMGSIADVLIGEASSFTQFIGDHAIEKSKASDATQGLQLFYEDISNLWGTNRIDFLFLHTVPKPKTDLKEIAFWFAGVYSDWEKAFKGLRNDLPISKFAINEHIKSEPYYIRSDSVRFPDNKIHFSIIFNGDHPKFPEEFRHILHTQERL